MRLKAPERQIPPGPKRARSIGAARDVINPALHRVHALLRALEGASDSHAEGRAQEGIALGEQLRPGGRIIQLVVQTLEADQRDLAAC